MAVSIEAQTTWQNLLPFYDEFEQHEGWEHIRPFRQLVAHLAETPFACRLFATTSHEILVVSPVATYPEWRKCPFVAIRPQKDAITVEYWLKEHQMLEKTECAFSSAREAVIPFLERLIVSDDAG